MITRVRCRSNVQVDLILHPLKSELNFPTGEKFDLDGAEQGERWLLPITLVDAIFHAATGRVYTSEARGAALDVLERLGAAVEEGYRCMALQRLPHITLLDHDYYHAALKPILAEWCFVWLQGQHLHGIDAKDAIEYLLEVRSRNQNDVAPSSTRNHGHTEYKLLEVRSKEEYCCALNH